MFEKTVITKNFEETRELGEKIVRKLNDTNILALYGNLGSGKTTFTQGLAKGLGIDQKIISPTFIIVRKYELGSNNQNLRFKNFYHIDLYRIADEGDIKSLGLEEILDDKSNIVAIEWPEKIENILPNKIMRLYFEYLENDKREIKIK
jgi:tRNA threonylcarbamoyladenosine biosynthesis protein TsaE